MTGRLAPGKAAGVDRNFREQNPGGIYRVMNLGNPRTEIVRDHVDRQRLAGGNPGGDGAAGDAAEGEVCHRAAAARNARAPLGAPASLAQARRQESMRLRANPFRKLAHLVVLGFVVVLAEHVMSEEAPTWGPEFHGVQMSVSMTNTDLLVGATNWLRCRVQSTFTNPVAMPSYNWEGTVLRLLTGTNLAYQLTPTVSITSSGRFGWIIKPGATHEWTVPLIITNGISPGRYQLEACRLVGIAYLDSWLAVSNPLDINVIANRSKRQQRSSRSWRTGLTGSSAEARKHNPLDRPLPGYIPSTVIID